MDLNKIEHQIDDEIHHIVDVVKMKNILLILIILALTYLYLFVID